MLRKFYNKEEKEKKDVSQFFSSSHTRDISIKSRAISNMFFNAVRIPKQIEDSSTSNPIAVFNMKNDKERYLNRNLFNKNDTSAYRDFAKNERDMGVKTYNNAFRKPSVLHKGINNILQGQDKIGPDLKMIREDNSGQLAKLNKIRQEADKDAYQYLKNYQKQRFQDLLLNIEEEIKITIDWMYIKKKLY